MTLIIAAGNSEQFIQVSDRRLTVNGVVNDDESNKAIVLNCANARLAIGFTGLAKFSSFNTRDWLLSTLNECGPPDYTAGNILNRFKDRATQDFQSLSALGGLPQQNKRLSIMFTGYLYHHQPPLGALAILSNFQNIDTGVVSTEAWNHFKCFFREERRPNNGKISLFYSIGTLPPVDKNDLKKLTMLVKFGKPANAIVGKIVRMFHNLANRPEAKNMIGKQLNSIILPRDKTLSAESQYHSNTIKQESYLPDQIYVVSKKLRFNVTDISVKPVDPTNTPPLSGPKLKPGQRCWCNSGKKYKHCHGRKSKHSTKLGFIARPSD